MCLVCRLVAGHIFRRLKSPRRIRNREINVNYMEKIYVIFGQRSSLGGEKEKEPTGARWSGFWRLFGVSKVPLSWSKPALGPPHDHRTELRSVERQRVKNGIPLVWKIEVSRRACSWLLALKALLASAYLISLSIMCTRLRGFASLSPSPHSLPSHVAAHSCWKNIFIFFSIEKFKLLFTLKKSRSSRANHNKYLSSFFSTLHAQYWLRLRACLKAPKRVVCFVIFFCAAVPYVARRVLHLTCRWIY